VWREKKPHFDVGLLEKFGPLGESQSQRQQQQQLLQVTVDPSAPLDIFSSLGDYSSKAALL
jgi:hypothetical protein